MTANQWTFGAAVFASATDFKIYRDGGNVGSDTTNVAFGSPTETHIGVDDDPANYFKGSIDDVRMYNRALSAREIYDLYNTGR